MDSIFKVSISPLDNSNWSIKAAVGDKKIIDEEITEKALIVGLLGKIDKSLEADAFIRKGDANTDAYSRFMQNPYESPIERERLNNEHAKNPELRIFNNKEEYRVAAHNAFTIERQIKNALKKAGIKPEVAQKEFVKALNRIV